MKRTMILLSLVGALFLTSDAMARNTVVLGSVAEAKNSQLGEDTLLDIPFYMKGQKHPRVQKKVGNYKSTRKSRGAFRSDEESCRTTFLSAIISLQQRAIKEGGNGIINIVSITKNKNYENAVNYRCVAGSILVNVALKGDVVKFAK